MIFPEEKEILKKTIGRGYAKKVKKWLDDQGIKDLKKQSYSENFITGVMNGYSHEEIETQIFRCAEFYKSEKLKSAQKKKDILNRLKTNSPVK